MALTPEQLDEVRKELAARMGGDSTFKNPRTEGAGFMGFGTKTDPLLGNPAPSDNLTTDSAGNTIQKSEVPDAGVAARQGYQNASSQKNGQNDFLSNALKNYKPKQSSAPDEIQPVAEEEFAPWGGDTAPQEFAPWGGDTAAPTTEFAPWGGDTAASTTEFAPWGGDTPASGGAESAGGSWGGAALGALAGMNQGHQNYLDDPNMRSGQDGYGKYHRDYRAEVGGGFLGGVLGYYGGPVGAAFAGPAVKLAHPYAERGTREVMNFGDKIGGESGSLTFDPIGTMASGKYSWGDLGKGALLGPAKKWFNL